MMLKSNTVNLMIKLTFVYVFNFTVYNVTEWLQNISSSKCANDQFL